MNRGKLLMMKKIVSTTFCTLLLCSLILITVGPTIIVAQDYERFSRPTQVIPTIDGEWTTDDEWTDGEFTWIGTDVAFTSTWDSQGSDVYTRWIVEFITDTTDDPGDFWLFSIDADQSGGSEPIGVRRFDITGHTDLVWYMGGGGLGGEGWVDATEQDPTAVTWANSFSASPTSDTPHWILEFQKIKGVQPSMGILWNFLLQVYDANTHEVYTWPPNANLDIPEEYGIENYSTEAIPEGLTFAVMALLTTVSMLVGYKYFLKRKETKTQ